MAVVRKSSSGKAIQFIVGNEDCPPGTVFQLSASLFGGVMSGSINGPYVVLTRLAIPAGASQFPPSSVWSPSGVVEASSKAGVHGGFSKEFVSERKEQQSGDRAKSFTPKW